MSHQSVTRRDVERGECFADRCHGCCRGLTCPPTPECAEWFKSWTCNASAQLFNTLAAMLLLRFWRMRSSSSGSWHTARGLKVGKARNANPRCLEGLNYVLTEVVATGPTSTARWPLGGAVPIASSHASAGVGSESRAKASVGVSRGSRCCRQKSDRRRSGRPPSCR